MPCLPFLQGASVFAYLGIFSSAFVSATLLPAQSEAVLGALLAGGGHSPVLLIAVATLGNTLGAATNWLLGLYVNRFKERRWFPVRPDRLAQAETRKQLKNVRKELTADIDSLGLTLKCINIALVPVLVVLFGLLRGYLRRKRA